MKRYILGFTLFLVMTLAGMPAFARTYSDLPKDHWAAFYVNTLSEQDIVWGYPDGTYKPDQNITRAEFASMAVRALGHVNAKVSEKPTFTDVPKTHWAYPYIEKAVYFDLIQKDPSGKFRPNDPVSRGEIISIVVNSLDTQEMTFEQARELLEKSYSDVDSLAEAFAIQAGKAQLMDITVKLPEQGNTLEASRAAKRGEATAFLYKMQQQVKIRPNKKIARAKFRRAEGFPVDRVLLDNNIAYLPRGLEFPIIIDNGVSSQFTRKNTLFTAKIADNVVTRKEGYLLLSKGGEITGTITRAGRAIPFIKNGKIVADAQTIRTADNNQTVQFYTNAKLNPQYRNIRQQFVNAIFKFGIVKYDDGDVIMIRLMEPVMVDLINGWIVDEQYVNQMQQLQQQYINTPATTHPDAQSNAETQQ